VPCSNVPSPNITDSLLFLPIYEKNNTWSAERGTWNRKKTEKNLKKTKKKKNPDSVRINFPQSVLK
jgi:hypothetical protein